MGSPVRPERAEDDSAAAHRARNRRALELLRQRTGYGHQFKQRGYPEGPGDYAVDPPRDTEFKRPEPTEPGYFGLEASRRRRLQSMRRV